MKTENEKRPPGRPPAEDGYSESLGIRVRRGTRAALERAADADGITWQKTAQRVLEAWARDRAEGA